MNKDLDVGSDKLKTVLCYLCGKPLSEPTNVDHIPMKQLWTPEIRKTHGPNLQTRRVHRQCNSDYQLDENYFLATILPLAKGSYAGESHYRKLATDIISKKELPLKIQVLNEFSDKVGGIHLPNSKIAKSFDTRRFNRIIWKIIRGLFFVHNDEVLPVEWPILRDVFIDNPPEHFLLFNSLPNISEHGAYPGVFSYRYTKLMEPDGLHYWAMLFLDQIIITVSFDDLK